VSPLDLRDVGPRADAVVAAATAASTTLAR
jgi:hypothetical protein